MNSSIMLNRIPFNKKISYSDMLETFNQIFSKKQDSAAVPIKTAIGKFLAEDLVTSVPIPSIPKSYRNGIAIGKEAFQQLKESGTWRGKITGEVWADEKIDIKLTDKNALVVYAGAFLPLSTAIVIPFELCEIKTEDNTQVVHISNVPPHILSDKGFLDVGEEFTPGQVILRKNAFLSPEKLYLLRYFRKNKIKVVKPIKIGILSIGTELTPLSGDNSLSNASSSRILSDVNGQLFNYDTNGPTIEKFVEFFHGEPHYFGIAEDDPDLLKEMLPTLSKQVDLLVTTGGTGNSEFDFLPQVLPEIGDVLFHGIEFNPFLNIFFTQVNKNHYILSFPGNPLICCGALHAVLVRIIASYYHIDTESFMCAGMLQQDIVKTTNEAQLFLLKQCGQELCPLLEENQPLQTFSVADGILILPEGEITLKKGQVVSYYSLNHF